MDASPSLTPGNSLTTSPTTGKSLTTPTTSKNSLTDRGGNIVGAAAAAAATTAATIAGSAASENTQVAIRPCNSASDVNCYSKKHVDDQLNRDMPCADYTEDSSLRNSECWVQTTPSEAQIRTMDEYVQQPGWMRNNSQLSVGGRWYRRPCEPALDAFCRTSDVDANNDGLHDYYNDHVE